MQINQLVMHFHKCVMEGEEYVEKDWESLMELPPHFSRRNPGSPSPVKKTTCAILLLSLQDSFSSFCKPLLGKGLCTFTILSEWQPDPFGSLDWIFRRSLWAFDAVLQTLFGLYTL